MRQLQRRVQRDLDRIADRAPVSSESWDQLRHRVAVEPDRTEEEVIMLAPAEPTPTRPRWVPVAFAVAAVALLAVAGILVLRATGDDDPDLLTADGTTDAFDPALDDLCTRVTGDDIVAHLNAAGEDVEGPATPTEPAAWLGMDCAWTLASGEEVQLGGRATFPLPMYDVEEADEPDYYGYVEYERPGQIVSGGYVIGHPELGDEVSVKDTSAWGQPSVRIHPLGSQNELSVGYVPRYEWACDDSGVCDEAARRYESVLMSVADAVLEDLGWPAPVTIVEEEPAGVTEVDWQYGSSVPGELRDVVAWSGGLAAIMDADGDETSTGGAVWSSTDGVEWSNGLWEDSLGDAYMLAGQNGDLFALTGDPDGENTTQTLWHLHGDAGWNEIVTSPALDHMAVGSERLIAYGEVGFTVLGVFDTATLEPVEVAALPTLDFGATGTDPTTGEPFEPAMTEGHAVALDEGFLASFHWVTGVDGDGELVREQTLMYSADGSTWIEHPDPPAGEIVLPYWGTTPVHDGLNLLSLPNRVDTEPWITDDGLSFSAATDPGLGGPTGTATGFFSVDGGNRIHRSVDGVTWSVLATPPTWPNAASPVAAEDGEVQHGSVVTLGDRLVAIGIRGDFEGWVGIVDPSTEIWVADR